MGVVKYSDYSDDSPDALIHKADQAMYEVNASGGGILMYNATFIPEHEAFTRHTVAKM